MNRDERIVVVGGGLTGLRAAERLRELKFEGDITILGDEKLPPYHRPALSKQLLQGSLRPSDLTLPAYEDLNARWRFGTQVRQLIPNKKTLVLPGGEEMTYDGLIIATGVEATRQNNVPYHDPRVLVLRTMSDGLDLERVIGGTKGRVAVVGGGFTGCELAASLRYLSREVTLIGRGKNLLGNVLGPDLGEWLTAEHRDHGVDLALGNSIEEWNPTAEGIGLKLTDGSTLMVSCVILAAGTKPMTHWLRGSGLPLDNGVVCEPTCHVVGADDVVAAGDVAQWPNLRFDNVPRRVEHWLNAVEMGRAAAENLIAGRASSEPFTPMPRFWTDQYSFRIQAAGMLKLGKDIVKLGTKDEGTGTVYGFSLEGRLMGVVGVDCPGAMIQWADSVSRQNPEPRPRIEVESEAKTPVAVGGGASTSTGLMKKRAPGKHAVPPREKQFQREDRAEPAAVGYVEQPTPAVIGVGAGPVPTGQPRNVVDSFSRMLPVAVRPPQAAGGPPPPNGRPPVPPNNLPMGAAPFGTPSNQSGPLSRPVNGNPSGPLSRASMPAVPPVNGNPSGPLSRPSMPPVPPVNGFPSGLPASGLPSGPSLPPTNSIPSMPPVNAVPPTTSIPSGPIANGLNAGPRGPISAPYGDGASTSGAFRRVTNGSSTGSFNNGSTSGAFSNGTNGHGTNGHGSNGNGRLINGIGTPIGGSNGHANGHSRNGLPTNPFGAPQNGRPALGPATGRIPSRDITPPAFSAAEMTDVGRGIPEPLSGRLGPNGGLPIDVTGEMASLDANGHVRTPEFSDTPPPRRGPSDSFGGMPPVSRDSGPIRRAEESFSALPPARRGPEDSFGGMPPARRGTNGSAQESFSALPPARRGPEDSFGGMPPARHSSGKTSESMPLARAAEQSFGSMPPARRGSSDSFSSMPPVRRSDETAVEGMPPARPATNGKRSRSEDSFSAMPPARRSSSDSFSSLPPVPELPPLPPARPTNGRRARSSSDSYSSMPAVRRSDETTVNGFEETAVNGLSAARHRSEDSYSSMPPASRSTGGRRRAEDSYSALPAVSSDSRQAAHRAEDLAPEFGRPPTRRTVDPDLSSLRLVPALSSMDDSIEMPPVRMPKHGRPEDYGHVPPARGGPEDSYDRMPAVERQGGRRRARA